MPWRPSASDPGARERDLPDGGGGLRVLELQRAARQLEHRAPERDRARRHDQHVAAVLVQRRDILGERGEPFLVHAAGRAVDEERGADLDDDAAEIGEARGFMGHDRYGTRCVCHRPALLAPN